MDVTTYSDLILAHYLMKQHYLPQPQPILVGSDENAKESCNNQLCGMKTHGIIEILVEQACYYLF